MKRLSLVFAVLLLVGCGGGKAEEKAEKGAEQRAQIKPPANLSHPAMAKQWEAFKKSEAVNYAPPGFQLEGFGEDEKGFVAWGNVKGKTQEDIINFYTSKLGEPTKKAQNPVMGNAVTLVWEGEKFSVMIRQKEGGVSVHYSKGKKGGAR